jgi:hypothetical protein
MPTKKELEERFGISDNTVYKTLKACGLDTSKTNYSEEEIEERFVPARKMLDSKQYTFKEVEEFFAMKDAKTPTSKKKTAQPAEANPAEYMEVLREEVTETVSNIVEYAVSDAIELVPQLLHLHLLSQSRSGNIQKKFLEIREQFARMHAQNPYDFNVVDVPIAGLGGGENEDEDIPPSDEEEGDDE